MLAEDNRKLIYPVRLEDIDAKGLAYWLHDYQWVDWIDRRDATIQKMIETIKRQVGSRTKEDEAAPETEAPPDKATEEKAEEKPAAPAAKAETKKATGKKEAEAPPSPPPPAPAPPPPPPPPPAAAKPADAGAAPMGLTGAAATADAGGSAKFPGAGLGRNAWIAIGAGALLLAILLGLAVNALLDGGSEFKVRPGQWTTSYDFDRTLVNRRLSAAEAQTVVQNIDSSTATQCIYEDDAREPGDDFFDPNGINNCTAQSIEMEGGTFRARLECRPDDLGGDSLDVWMRGTYDREEIRAEAEYAIAAGTNREFRFVTNEVKRFISGSCD
jgi:hypothetical protein